MSAPALVCVLIVAIALIVVLIVRVKLHPALALTLAAFGVGIVTGTPGHPRRHDRNRCGRDRATWVMMLIGFIAGIPVFVEVGFVLLVPLVFVIARQAKISVIKIGIPLVTSLMVVHCIVPPHPAATAIAGTLWERTSERSSLSACSSACPAPQSAVPCSRASASEAPSPLPSQRAGSPRAARETRALTRRRRGGSPRRSPSRTGACPASGSLSSRSCCPSSSWSGALSWSRCFPRAAGPCPSSTSSATRSTRCSSRSSSPTGRSASGAAGGERPA